MKNALGLTTARLAAALAVATATSAAAAPVASLNPTTLAFGAQSMGTTSPAQTITVTNTGNATLNVGAVTAPSADFTVGSACGAVAVGANCLIYVTFSPQPTGGALNSTNPVSGNVTIASNGTGSPQSVAVSGTGEKSLVTHYYRAILQRAPDAGGKQFWLNETLRLSGLSANVNEVWYAMAAFFFFSAEYNGFNQNNTGFVTDLYKTFFNRPPDTSGLNFWVGQLNSGLPREVALAGFMFSPEFVGFTQGIFGNTAARAEIDVVGDFYRGLLARLPDDGGFAYWVQQFRNAQCAGGGSAANAVNGQVDSISSQFANGSEYTSKNRTNAQYVGDLYNGFLRRGGDLNGVNFWINQLNTSAMSRNTVRTQFIQSPEFQARVTAVVNQGCIANTLRVSVGGFGYVTSSAGSLSCGHLPAATGGTSTKCATQGVNGTVALTATPYNASFQFAGWSGDTTCTNQNPCNVDVTSSKWVRAKFTTVTPNGNYCQALGLVSDKNNHPLNANYPVLTVGQSFVDPNFGTTIRRIGDVAHDGRGSNKALVPAYATTPAWNSDESYLILYRTSGTGAGHELFNGKTYAFIRKLDDLPYVDLEQIYWDKTKPNIIYGADRVAKKLYKYDVDAPQGQRLTALHTFTAQCGSNDLTGGSDPFNNSWDSNIFGFSCAPDGVMFSYNAATDTLGTVAPASTPRADSYGSVQATPGGTKMFVNAPKPAGAGSGNAMRLYDLNMVAGPFLDMNSGDEHGDTNMLSNGDSTHNAIQFDPSGTSGGTQNGTIVQWNLNAAPAASGRINGRVIVGPATGYPYPPGGTHVSGTSYNRTGLVVASVKGSMTGATLLDDELIFVDSDLATNGGNFACRVGHHRTKSDDYWAEPHPSISPSGTRIVFGSSWGSTADPAIVDAYVVELPGYKP